jgi:hypothetical protein
MLINPAVKASLRDPLYPLSHNANQLVYFSPDFAVGFVARLRKA